jgi:hypothetical protein
MRPAIRTLAPARVPIQDVASMTDDKQRVDWSALMDAHGMDPDADTRGPAVEPDQRKVAEAQPRGRSRMVNGLIAVTALFSIAASVAVLVVLLGGGKEDAATPEQEASGPRPAAFEQTSDGVIVVPPVAEEPVPQPAAEKPIPTEKKPADNKPTEKKPTEKKPTEKKPAEQPAEVPAPPADDNLPDEPDQAAVATAMDALHKDIAACAAPAGVSGEVGIKMRIEPDGKVAWASARLENSPFQSCLDRLFKKAKMPRSVKGATVRQTARLP